MSERGQENSLRFKLYDILEGRGEATNRARLLDILLTALIVANVVAVSLETVDDIYARYRILFETFEYFSVTIFTIEYVLRIWASVEHIPLRRFGPIKARLKFALSPFMIIDLLAILPTVAFALFGADFRILRIFRLVRIFKLARYSPAMMTLGYVLYVERRALSASVIIMFGLLMVTSAIMYFIERFEQPEVFGSIPSAMWWSMATLTTVGYGDVVPHTVIGKVFGGIVTILGIGMYGLPIAIIASGFTKEFYRRDFVVTWGMVARAPIFSKLAPDTLEAITRTLRARQVPPGYEIMRRGDPADAMYVIISGQVRVEMPDKQLILGDGEFFGVISLLYNIDRPATVDARTECRLLVLLKNDFDHLIETEPDFYAEVKFVVEERTDGTELAQT